ncbi:SDR family NAD(P)-dependent oxidoreductase [Pedobacter foliorum]|uniref:SDR family NAD(P)-dependent oxidoreductase n=1 Tax=Pedobacter foliorum TaxID=2739058 RepID=UPI001563147D|nr:SDR family NAD(P)-dependent oxidoreductase [Pedobacter foliorum]NRF39193.1 SDR family NAD(P)-dependent oxidoreductase [Pedobacter foliorum]
MKKIFIITGANRGLGKAFVDLVLKDDDAMVISLSRSLHEEHLDIPNDRLVFIPVDLLKPFSSSIFDLIKENLDPTSIIYFLNNAGVILPINSIGSLDQVDISASIKVNVEYPVNLINMVLKNCTLNTLIIVNVTSGAAIKPIANWSLYGASKAFMRMFFSVLAEENIGNEKLKLFNIDPGTMDTEMQSSIRKNAFPRNEYFQSLKETNRLINPQDAALDILRQIDF